MAQREYQKTLGSLLADLSLPDEIAAINVRALALDSRQVEKGALFIAVSGHAEDGRHYIKDAIARGAVAVLVEDDGGGETRDLSVPVIPVSKLRSRIGLLADIFYDQPTRDMTIIGVTGTNGKTTCVNLLSQALHDTRHPCGHIGTLGYGFPGALHPASHTTPDALRVQRLMAMFRDAGARYVCMEVSSHALEQGRVSGVHFDVAVFTNLSRDHLDYHGDMEQYALAKAKLFDAPGLTAAIINIDDDYGRQLASNLSKSTTVRPVSLWRYGIGHGEVSAEHVDVLHDALELKIAVRDKQLMCRAHLVGRFNIHNLLAVIATLHVTGTAFESIASVVERLRPVAGRMELFEHPGRPLVVVDYAHTPDALEKALSALREHTRGQLWCVFGCGGDRDRGKRPQMGQVAEQGADHVVLTDDNPRTENPDGIIAEIASGMSSQAVVIRERKAAIRHAICQAAVDDAVLVAGKGHEDYQEVMGVRLHYSDRDTVRHVLEEAA